MSIQFFFQKAVPGLRNRQALKLFLSSLFKKEKYSLVSLTCIFCSDDDLLKINREFLQHDYYTDIITFNLASKNGPIVGELYISIDRVRDNAKKEGTTLKEELHRVIFHGALHLCGYKDKKNREKIEMQRGEKKYLEAYFGYVPRIPVSMRNMNK